MINKMVSTGILLLYLAILFSCSSWNNPFKPSIPDGVENDNTSGTTFSDPCILHGQISVRTTIDSTTADYFPLTILIQNRFFAATVFTDETGHYSAALKKERYEIILGININDAGNNSYSSCVFNTDSLNLADYDSLNQDYQISLADRGLQGCIKDDKGNAVSLVKVSVVEFWNSIGQYSVPVNSYSHTDATGFFRTAGWYFLALDTLQGISLINKWVLLFEKEGFTSFYDTIETPDSNYQWSDAAIVLHEKLNITITAAGVVADTVDYKIIVQGTAERIKFADTTVTNTLTPVTFTVPYGTIKVRTGPPAGNTASITPFDTTVTFTKDDTLFIPVIISLD